MPTASQGQGGNAYLHDCLRDCRDLGSDSTELQGKIIDWYSEYHLSPARANLVRWLKLDHLKDVLELGCGSGTITRYLGQAGLRVTAVDSCPEKADLARIRCRDLDNVHITTADYQELPLRTRQFDAIFLVGTLDHILCPTKRVPQPERAIKAFIEQIKQSLKQTGVLIVAAENKTGLKFRSTTWKTRCQNLGINHAPPAGTIPPHGKREWMNILLNTDDFCTLAYPFPDYRLPRVLLFDEYIHADPFSYSLLYRVLSKDQYLDWQADDDEFLSWKALHESGSLHEHTNSFLMLIAAQDSAIKRIAPYDFIHFSSENRRLEYRTITFKRQGQERVIKKLLCPNSQDITSLKGNIRITEIDAAYARGPLVTTLWLEACASSDFHGNFGRLLREYRLFVYHQATILKDPSFLVDLLPSNLVATYGEKLYHYVPIDQEWSYAEPFPIDFVLFRAFLWFGFHNRSTISYHRANHAWKTVGDFVEYCFSRLGIPLGSYIETYISLEDTFHAQIAIKGFDFSARGLLAVTIANEQLDTKLQ